MASGRTIHTTLAGGTVSGAHTAVTTTITFTTGQEFPTDLATGEFAKVTVGPAAAFGDPTRYDELEVVHLVGPYTAGDPTGTIERGQEGTTGLAWDDGDTWLTGVYASDLVVEQEGGLHLIEEIRLTANGTITFDNIPAGFGDLLIEGAVRSTRAATNADEITLRMGDGSIDTGATAYRYQTYRFGSSSPANSGNNGDAFILTGDGVPASTSAAGDFATLRCDIAAYDDADKFTSVVGLAGSTQGFAALFGGTHLSAIAVDVIEVDAQNGDLAAGSVLRLYGVKARNGYVPVSFTGAKVRAPDGQSIPNNSAQIIDLTGGTVVFDSHGFADLANDRLTVPSGMGGKYLAIVHMELDPDTDYLTSQVAIMVNGTLLSADLVPMGGGSGAPQRVAIATPELAPGDYVQGRALQTNTSGGASAINSTADDDRTTVELIRLGQAVANSLPPTLIVRDEKASGTHAGTLTSGAWQTRDLNTVDTNEISGASLAANQVTLPAGTYEVEWSAPAVKVDRHQTRLRNVTDSTDLVIGHSEIAEVASNVQTRSGGRGRFTLAATKTIELQHQCSTTKTSNGLGNAASFGVVEVYAELVIRQVG